MKSQKLILSKYLFLSFLGMGLAFSSCKKEEEVATDPINQPSPNEKIVHTRTQVPIMVKATGEGCPACGSWGWDAWKDLSKDFEGRAFCWSNYAGNYAPATGFRGQELRAPISDAVVLLSRFSGVTGYPNFITNMVSSGTSTANAAAAANASIANSDIKISAGFKHKIEGNTLTIDAEAKVWEAITGDYYLGAYLVEDKIVTFQAGTDAGGSNAEHKQVFRGSLTSNSTWGEQIIFGSESENTILPMTFSVELPIGYNKENLSYGIIIWEKVGGAYQYVNAATNQ